MHFIISSVPIAFRLSTLLQSSYPLPLDDDLKPLSYYGLSPPTGDVSSSSSEPGSTSTASSSSSAAAAAASIGEILLEEVDSAEAARKAAEAAAAEEARHASQAALGDALRMAAEQERRGPLLQPAR